MLSRTWIFIGIGLTAFCAYTVTTGGLAVTNINDFGGQRDIQLAGGLKSDIWMAPESSRFELPFVFHYYGAGEPFGLRIQIWDDSKKFRSIEITEIVLEYQDGEVVRKTDGWSRQLQPYTQHHSSSSGVIQTEMFMLSDEIERLVLRHADVRITLKGQLERAGGERIAFDASEFFTAQTRSGVTTVWEMLAGC